jgi:hypothetical protein
MNSGFLSASTITTVCQFSSQAAKAAKVVILLSRLFDSDPSRIAEKIRDCE